MGDSLLCGIEMLRFGCTPGQPVEQHIYHSADPDAVPAVYQLVRIR